MTGPTITDVRNAIESALNTIHPDNNFSTKVSKSLMVPFTEIGRGQKQPRNYPRFSISMDSLEGANLPSSRYLRSVGFWIIGIFLDKDATGRTVQKQVEDFVEDFDKWLSEYHDLGGIVDFVRLESIDVDYMTAHPEGFFIALLTVQYQRN